MERKAKKMYKMKCGKRRPFVQFLYKYATKLHIHTHVVKKSSLK